MNLQNVNKGLGIIALTWGLCACHAVNNATSSQLSTQAETKSAIVKSPNDNREYKAITLANQLEVLLVSDPSIEKSAVALSVGVGSFQEPKGFGGLAHYLEHMLFLGTKTYPNVGDYSEFVSQNGGTQNAYTELDHTNYMVAVNNNAYDEALKRFSRFFYEATLDPHYADKERRAVHSEWTMKSPNDWVILGQLDGLTLNPEHPISQFNWGNLDSLSDKNQRTLQDALVQLYETYYSANLMKAAMVSDLPLSEMEKMAERYFSLIPNKHTPRPTVNVPVATPDNLNKIVHYVPQAEMKQLRVSFVIKNNAEQFAVKPNGFVNYILNNEMPGTLASVLRDEGLSEGLYTSFDPDEYGNAGSFNLFIDLTESGLQQRDRVMAAVLKYLDLLRSKGVDERYFKEIRQSLSNRFRFKEKTDDYDYAMQIAADLQHIPTEYVLSSEYEYQRFNPQAVQDVLEQLTLKHARIFYIDKGQVSDTSMQYFAGKYALENISPAQLKTWKALGSEFSMHLPRPNALMPENFELVAPLSSVKPQLIATEVGYSAYLAQSTFFAQPKGLLTLDLNSAVVKSSAKTQVMADLLNRGLSHAITELQNEAYAAGMGINVSLNNGVSVTASGFSDKQGELLRLGIEQFMSYEMSESELANAKAAFKSDMQSKKMGVLLDQLFPAFSRLVILDEYSDETLLKQVESIDLESLKTFKAALFQRANMRVFAFGNYTAQQVKDWSALLLKELPSKREISPVYDSPRLMPKPGETYSWQEDVTLSDVGFVDAYISPRNTQDSASAQILSQLIQPALFKQIRTEEQLAYAVGFINQTNKTQMLSAFYIQSPALGLASVAERITNFRQGFSEQLANLPEDVFATTKQSVLITLMQAPKNLSEEMWRWMGDWHEQNYAFNSRQQLIEAIQNVTKKDVLALYNRMQDGRSFGQVMVQMRGTEFAKEAFAKAKDEIQIKDIDLFHQKMLKQ